MSSGFPLGQLRSSEDFDPALRDEHRVFELGRPRAIRSFDCPTVLEKYHLGSTEIDHGFDGEGHPFLQPKSPSRSPNVGHVRGLMHAPSDAVPTQTFDHRAASLSRNLHDGMGDVSQSRPRTDHGDACFATPPRDVHDVPRLLTDGSHADHGRSVSMKSSKLGGHVDVHDIAVLQNFML